MGIHRHFRSNALSDFFADHSDRQEITLELRKRVFPQFAR